MLGKDGDCVHSLVALVEEQRVALLAKDNALCVTISALGR